MKEQKRENRKKTMGKFFGREHWIGAGARCILNTTKRNDGITRVSGIDEIESMSFLSKKGKITFPKIMTDFYPCNQPAGARCISGTNARNVGITRVSDIDEIKSMYFESKKANIEELTKVKGITKELAERLKNL